MTRRFHSSAGSPPCGGAVAGGQGSRRAPCDLRVVVGDPRWGAKDRHRRLKWPAGVGEPERGPRVARVLTAAIIDTAFTADLCEAVVAPITLRCFAPGAVLRTGPLAAHGTAIACAVAGTRWPEGGLPGARLLCATIGDGDGASLASALRWSADEGADVLVLPLGAEAVDREVEATLGEILARPSPPVVIAALGNVFPAPGLFPANLPGVWAIAAADDDGRLLGDAARSPGPDLVAPGDRIVVRTNAFELASMRGSSIACAIAAGAALRRLSLHPEERPGPALLEALWLPTSPTNDREPVR